MFKISDRKLAEVIKKAGKGGDGVSGEATVDFVLADWHEGDEHQKWLETASSDEIAGWVIAGLR